MEALRLRLPRLLYAGGFDPLPGLLAVLGLAGLAHWLNGLFPPLSPVLLALLGGMVLGNAVGTPAAWKAGTSVAVKRLLRAGIVLLGAGLSFAQVLRIGGGALAVIAVLIVISLGVSIWTARLARLSGKMGVLVGMGTAICGVSAVVATAPAIEAEEEDVVFAVSVVTLFGMLAVLTYPLIGAYAGLSQTVFGTWAGTAINDTAQTVAAGFIYGPQAGEVATVVKLTRTLFLAPLLVVLGAWTALSAGAGRALGRTDLLRRAWQAFPTFVLGFVGLALLRALGLLPSGLAGFLPELGKFLIAMAIAGVGLSTRLQSMRVAGLRPLYVGLSAATVMAVVSFVLVRLFVPA